MELVFPKLEDIEPIARPAFLLLLYGIKVDDEVCDRLEGEVVEAFVRSEDLDNDAARAAFLKNKFHGRLPDLANLLGYSKPDTLRKHLERGGFGRMREKVVPIIDEQFGTEIPFPRNSERENRAFLAAMARARELLGFGEPRFRLSPARAVILICVCRDKSCIDALRNGQDRSASFADAVDDLAESIPDFYELMRAAGLRDHTDVAELTWEWRAVLDFCRVLFLT